MSGKRACVKGVQGLHVFEELVQLRFHLEAIQQYSSKLPLGQQLPLGQRLLPWLHPLLLVWLQYLGLV